MLFDRFRQARRRQRAQRLQHHIRARDIVVQRTHAQDFGSEIELGNAVQIDTTAGCQPTRHVPIGIGAETRLHHHFVRRRKNMELGKGKPHSGNARRIELCSEDSASLSRFAIGQKKRNCDRELIGGVGERLAIRQRAGGIVWRLILDKHFAPRRQCQRERDRAIADLRLGNAHLHLK